MDETILQAARRLVIAAQHRAFERAWTLGHSPEWLAEDSAYRIRRRQVQALREAIARHAQAGEISAAEAMRLLNRMMED